MSARVVHVRDGVAGAVYVGRRYPRGDLAESPFANPFRIGRDGDRGAVLRYYREWVLGSVALLSLLPELRGKPLACWCRHDGDVRPGAPACHADVLIGLLERYGDEELRGMADAARDNRANSDERLTFPGEIELLRDQTDVAEALVERLQALNAGALRGRSLSLAITEIETGWLWLQRALDEARSAAGVSQDAGR